MLAPLEDDNEGRRNVPNTVELEPSSRPFKQRREFFDEDCDPNVWQAVDDVVQDFTELGTAGEVQSIPQAPSSSGTRGRRSRSPMGLRRVLREPGGSERLDGLTGLRLRGVARHVQDQEERFEVSQTPQGKDCQIRENLKQILVIQILPQC